MSEPTTDTLRFLDVHKRFEGQRPVLQGLTADISTRELTFIAGASGSEMKVGALVLAAVAGIVGLLWLMGELRLGEATVLPVDFSHTGNVVTGAPVKLGGVQVGRVAEIRLLPERRDARGAPLPVRMELDVTPEARASLRQDATVMVATVGPLGEPYLELTENRGDLRSLTADLSATATDLRQLARLTREALQPGGTGARLLDDAAATAALMRRELPGLTRSAGQTLDGLAAVTAPLTPEDGQQLKLALERYAAAGAHLEQLSADSRRADQPARAAP